MSSLAVRDPAMDRSLRSVFVGNIPYEATEEQLKDIFSEVGSVVSFRLVYDRETGKPKGYGFCEYQDQETALSAMRNLNGREFSGRALRVDNAASEKNKEELKSLGPAAPIIDSPYGDPIDPEDAPESITRAVASLPPEQMFELMKQMKLCVQNSHQEARNMLLQNPQLAYALLQAQVVMRIMDPEIALKILHRKIHVTPLIPGKSQAGSVPGPVSGPGPASGLCPGPNVMLNQQNPPAPQPQHLARRSVKDIPPLMQTPIQGGIPAPGPIPAAVPGPGPASITPGGAMQPQVGMPGVGPVPLERGQVQMSDPRAPIPRGPMAAAGLPPRGLLGDAPNDPRGGTLLSVTGEVEPRGYLGPPHQGPPMHHASGHDGRGPSHDMRGGPMADPRMLIGEPRGPMIEQRGLPMDGRGGRESRGMETEVLETRVMERRGMDTCVMEARGMDARGLEMRGPGPSSRGPMTGGIQGPGPMTLGASGPQGPRQVPSISGVGNPGGGMQGAGMQGGGMQGAGMQGGGMQGAGMQGGGMQGAGMQGGGMQGAGMQGAGMQGGGMQGAGMQGGGMQGASKQGGGQPSSFSPGQSQVTPQDQEKAALIMQVLQLTADQIAMLPPEQRQSILILKEQIQKSTGAS
ncbi:cleavage stimulation factor subunit 2 tau variant isoform X2 [Perognathus longimembris pacificus]|uniref:cleavage stimulation factor subunit 2 tau variant isoform X2 n=1 Tax=Perognathus longimembris pacificus TaxID=214514 RepID=UPI0020187B52|nr:cleavage stimulation factor subunit 2 tau variant isoform X2 [Perognathus longimembris pacificus]